MRYSNTYYKRDYKNYNSISAWKKSSSPRVHFQHIFSNGVPNNKHSATH